MTKPKCCNHDCEQGRNCPLRREISLADWIAKITRALLKRKGSR